MDTVIRQNFKINVLYNFENESNSESYVSFKVKDRQHSLFLLHIEQEDYK